MDADALEAKMSPEAIITFRDLVKRCRLDEPVVFSDRAKSTVVAQYQWMLEQVARGQLKLTDAGYIPPKKVDALVEKFGWTREWPGKGNREIDTVPVRMMRLRMQRLGLVWPEDGVLHHTKLGWQGTDNPHGLWDYLAHEVRSQPTVLKRLAVDFLLLSTAGGTCSSEDEYLHSVADGLWSISSMKSTPVIFERKHTFGLIADAYELLHSLGVYSTTGETPEWHGPTITGVAFARHALAIPDEELWAFEPEWDMSRHTTGNWRSPVSYEYMRPDDPSGPVDNAAMG